MDVMVDARGENFEISWLESVEQPSGKAEPTDTGFGTRLELMIVRTLNAEISREWQPQGSHSLCGTNPDLDVPTPDQPAAQNGYRNNCCSLVGHQTFSCSPFAWSCPNHSP
ncbi:hypothetical protein [Rhizobium leguminosarum]